MLLVFSSEIRYMKIYSAFYCSLSVKTTVIHFSLLKIQIILATSTRNPRLSATPDFEPDYLTTSPHTPD